VDLVPVDLVVPAVLALVDSVDLVPVDLVVPAVPVLLADLADLVAVLHHAVPVVRADHNVKRPPVAVGIPKSSSRH
jgi:hypothetical protein